MIIETDLSHWQPCALPADAPLVGNRVLVRPADAQRDAAQLFEATREGNPDLWAYMPYGPFDTEPAFVSWFATHVADPDLRVMTIEDRSTGRSVGSASYMRMEPAQGVIEIGHIFLGPRLQRIAAATEAISLMLGHLLDDLGYRRVEWKCDAANARSVRAAERFGFVPEGGFRQHRIVKGRNRDTAWFSIIDSEWPALRDAFDAWLAPANFDATGVQIRRLEAFRDAR